jgi:hypothetical protein
MLKSDESPQERAMPDRNLAESLRRAVRFWRMLAIVSWIVLALGALGAIGLSAVHRDQVLRAAQAATEAREEAEKARAAETRAKERAEQMLYLSRIALAQKEMEQGEKKPPRED